MLIHFSGASAGFARLEGWAKNCGRLQRRDSPFCWKALIRAFGGCPCRFLGTWNSLHPILVGTLRRQRSALLVLRKFGGSKRAWLRCHPATVSSRNCENGQRVPLITSALSAVAIKVKPLAGLVHRLNHLIIRPLDLLRVQGFEMVRASGKLRNSTLAKMLIVDRWSQGSLYDQEEPCEVIRPTQFGLRLNNSTFQRIADEIFVSDMIQHGNEVTGVSGAGQSNTCNRRKRPGLVHI